MGIMARPPSINPALRVRLCAWLLLGSLYAGQLFAGVSLSFKVDDIEGGDWSILGIGATVTSVSAASTAIDIHIGRILLPEPHGELQALQLTCAEVLHLDAEWRCAEGKLKAGKSPFGVQETTWSGFWHADGGLQLDVAGLDVDGGSVALTVTKAAEGWRADLRPYRLQLRRLAKRGGVQLPSDWGIRGRVSGRLKIEGGD